MKEIPVGVHGHFAFVDDSDYHLVCHKRWQLVKGAAVYQDKKGKVKVVFMHRIIMNTPSGMVTDHINHNPLDNRRSNLRVCTHRENIRNQLVQRRKKSSRFKGVTWSKDKRKWQAQIGIDGKRYTLGRYKSEEEAARKYNETAIKAFGKFAYLNSV